MRRALVTFNMITIAFSVSVYAAATSKPVHKKQFVQRLMNHQGNLTTLLCEGIYASRHGQKFIKASYPPDTGCYALMLPLVVRYTHQYTKYLPKLVSQKQRDQVRDHISESASHDYLQKTVSIQRTLHFDEYLSHYPKIFCQRAYRNKQLRPIVIHLSQKQCISKVTPIAKKCLHDYQSKLPNNVHLDHINRTGYLVAACTSTKFLDHYLDRASKSRNRRI